MALGTARRQCAQPHGPLHLPLDFPYASLVGSGILQPAEHQHDDLELVCTRTGPGQARFLHLLLSIQGTSLIFSLSELRMFQ